MSSEETRFLNVDLELTTRGEIAPLFEHWSGNVVVLRDTVDDGDRTVWLELDPEHAEVEHVLLGFLDLVGKLSDELRALWNSCDDRCFNIGIQAGTKPHSSAFPIASDTLGRIAALNARVEFTVYGGSPSPDKGR